MDTAAAIDAILKYLEAMLENDIADNLAIGEYGAKDLVNES